MCVAVPGVCELRGRDGRQSKHGQEILAPPLLSRRRTALPVLTQRLPPVNHPRVRLPLTAAPPRGRGQQAPGDIPAPGPRRRHKPLLQLRSALARPAKPPASQTSLSLSYFSLFLQPKFTSNKISARFWWFLSRRGGFFLFRDVLYRIWLPCWSWGGWLIDCGGGAWRRAVLTLCQRW